MCRLSCLKKSRGIFAILSFTVCLSSFAYAQEVVNLVNNWDFEDGDVAPWRLIHRPNSGGVSTFGIDESESISGQASLKIEISEGGTHKRAVHVIQEPLTEPVVNGTDYTYAAWVKAEAERNMFMNLIQAGGGGIATPNNHEITVGPEWAEYWYTVTATSSNQIRVEFEMGLSDVDIWIDHVRFYEGDYVEEMLGQAPGLASNPSPADEAADVARDVVLAWNAGETTVNRNVYLGTNWDDVNDASSANPLDVLVGQDLTDTSLDVGRLAFEQTYYWRVDEVNGAPDQTVFRGNVWSFTVEPIAYPITSITATASGSFGESVPENTINGSGLVGDLHGTIAQDMWLSSGIPATIEYAFDRVYKLHELWVWNSNQSIESFIGFGAKDIVLEHSLDGQNWTVLEGVGPLAQGPGTPGYAHNNTIGLGGVTARHVRVTINTVHGFAPQASLSEVRFLYIPTLASQPDPVSGATGVAPDVTLAWGRDGREATRHEVYLGSDPDNLPLAGSIGESSFDTQVLDLQLGQTYSWRVDEVNESEDPSTWVGDLWSFTTVDTLIVDDMESYKDAEFFEIWATWVDGFEDPANGSLVGIGAAGTPETDIVHAGDQSLPMSYDNSAAAQSEATRTFDTAMDWTGHGVQGLALYFQGNPSNTGGSLYIKINDTKLAYDGDASNLTRFGWNKWYISLADVSGTNLGRVTSLTIGIEGGGAGIVYVDDIVLTPDARELTTPVEPVAGLVAYFPFDGDYQDASGNGLHGTPMGASNPAFEAGALGQAVGFDGIDQYVEISGYQGIVADRSDPDNPVQQPFTIACWVKTAENGELVTWGSSDGSPVGGQYSTFRLDGGSLRAEHGSGNLRGNTVLTDGEWHHAALTVVEGGFLRDSHSSLYVDGLIDTTFSGSDNIYNVTAEADVSIGRRASHGDRYFPGAIDEVRIYDRALSVAEIAWLAGRTQAFDTP